MQKIQNKPAIISNYLEFKKIIGTDYLKEDFDRDYTELLAQLSLNDALIIDKYIKKIIQYIFSQLQSSATK